MLYSWKLGEKKKLLAFTGIRTRVFTGGKLFDYLFIFDVWVPPVYLAIYFPTIYLVLIFFFLLWGWRSDGIRGKEVIMGGRVWCVVLHGISRLYKRAC